MISKYLLQFITINKEGRAQVVLKIIVSYVLSHCLTYAQHARSNWCQCTIAVLLAKTNLLILCLFLWEQYLNNLLIVTICFCFLTRATARAIARATYSIFSYLLCWDFEKIVCVIQLVTLDTMINFYVNRSRHFIWLYNSQHKK